jgi:hypothetical protein
MSDQEKAGVITSLEEVFLSREFGRSPSRGMPPLGGAYEPAEPPQLEEVFLSERFGHPEAVAATTAVFVAPTPALAALPGRIGTERDSARYRAIAALSGVAAAALVVVGVASGGGQTAKTPTVSAQGAGGSNPPGPTGGSPEGTPPPGSGGTGQDTTPAGTAASGGATGTPVAQLASVTTPSSPQVIVEVPAGTTVEVVTTTTTTTTPPPPPGSGGTPPTVPSGGGSVLTPLVVVVGNTVSTVGATVTATSTDLGNALPVASPLTGLLGNLGATVASLGRSVVGTAT